MAGERSVYGYVVRQASSTFDAQAPMSALKTVMLRNNIQHLTDQSYQVRHNWMASTSETGFTVGNDYDTDRSTYACMFALTITELNRLPSLDIAIWTRCTGTLTSGTFNVRVSWQFGNDSIFFTGAQAVSTASVTRHNFIYDAGDDPESYDGHGLSMPYIDPTMTGAPSLQHTDPSSFVQVMLVVNAFPSNSAIGQIGICGVCVREFLTP